MHNPKLKLPLQAEELIPHQKPMCLVDRLVEHNAQGGTVSAFVSSCNVLVDDNGRLDPLAVTELIAQASAVVKGYEDRLSDQPVKRGFLVGIREMVFRSDVFVGDHLEIRIQTVGAISGFTVVHGQVVRDQEIVADGELKLWVQDEDP